MRSRSGKTNSILVSPPDSEPSTLTTCIWKPHQMSHDAGREDVYFRYSKNNSLHIRQRFLVRLILWSPNESLRWSMRRSMRRSWYEAFSKKGSDISFVVVTGNTGRVNLCVSRGSAPCNDQFTLKCKLSLRLGEASIKHFWSFTAKWCCSVLLNNWSSKRN